VAELNGRTGVPDVKVSEAQIVVAVDLRAEELSGAVRLEGTDERRFVGWLGLLDALQRATGEAREVDVNSHEEE
jgi:hypothetical protein